jgi:hypothetical protein
MDQIPSNALILVGIMPALRDFEIARMLGWYRIPLKSSPKIVDVDYLAFYQGANFGSEHRWRIEFIAEYRGNELTTRRELLREEKDHPRAAEEYYKIQIGPLIQLENPISSGTWKRLTFVYTTGDLFSRAKIVNDLVVRSEDREILWKSLRERNLQAKRYQAGDDQVIPDDPIVLDLLLELFKTSGTLDLENY